MISAFKVYSIMFMESLIMMTSVLWWAVIAWNNVPEILTCLPRIGRASLEEAATWISVTLSSGSSKKSFLGASSLTCTGRSKVNTKICSLANGSVRRKISANQKFWMRPSEKWGDWRFAGAEMDRNDWYFCFCVVSRTSRGRSHWAWRGAWIHRRGAR